MTTLLLAHISGSYYLRIYGAKVEEVLEKESIDFSYPRAPEDWAVPTNDFPRREVLDLLNITRVFTITGFIDKNSKCDSTWASTGTSAPEARDTLVNMDRYGGPIVFYYGMPFDAATGYTSSSNNRYFYLNSTTPSESDGFLGFIRRIMINETLEDSEISRVQNFLDGNITNVATSITVKDASSFSSSGTIQLEEELITYTSKTATQFLGCTRGTSTTIAKAHTSGTPVSQVGTTDTYNLPEKYEITLSILVGKKMQL